MVYLGTTFLPLHTPARDMTKGSCMLDGPFLALTQYTPTRAIIKAPPATGKKKINKRQENILENEFQY